MKILAGRNFYEQFGHKVTEICPDCDWALLEPDGSWSDTPHDAEIAALISDAYCQKFKNFILNAPNIKWVHTENTGVDDSFYGELLDRGVLLTRSSGANAPEVAEFVFGMILWTTKCLGTFHLQQKDFSWENRQLQGLSDKTILLVGLGAIGSRVARIAKSFDMYVLGIRKNIQQISGVDELGTLADLHEFLPRADIIVLALPLTSLTDRLINGAEFEMMKDTVIFINVARGKMVDIDALKKHLSQKSEMHACLDVFPVEPLPTDEELWSMPNVLITPHIAFSSKLYRPRVTEIWLDNLKRFKEGLQLKDIVSP
jgi:phosphoglycerate dehydrogenase-like enzyme